MLFKTFAKLYNPAIQKVPLIAFLVNNADVTPFITAQLKYYTQPSRNSVEKPTLAPFFVELFYNWSVFLFKKPVKPKSKIF